MNHDKNIHLPFAAIFVVLFALGFVFVTDQSFWLDEVCSAAKPAQPSFSAFLSKLFAMGGTEVQSPLHMVLLWGWARITGTTEWALRSVNLLFWGVALAVVASERSLSRSLRICWGVASGLSPLVSFYLDELRPWMLVFACATLVTAPLADIDQSSTPTGPQVRRLLAGIVLLSAASLTGAVFAFWAGSLFMAKTIRDRMLPVLLRRHRVSFAASAASLAALCVYYLWTVRAGYGGTHGHPTTFFSTGFCAYEFLGFSGMGPGRAALRENWAEALSNALPALLVLSAAWILFVTAARKSRLDSVGSILLRPVFLFPILGSLSLLAAGIAIRERVLARHLMSALPAFLLAVAGTADRTWRNGGRFGRVATMALFAAWLASGLSLRFSARHAKEDIRRAAAFARSAAENGARVWWIANPGAFQYYPQPDGEAGKRITAMPETGRTPGEPADVAVVYSKHDISDPDGSRRAFLRDNGFVPDGPDIRGFSVWYRFPGKSSAARHCGRQVGEE